MNSMNALSSTVSLATITLFILVLFSCKQDPIYIDYCKMIDDDQSFVNTNKRDLEQYNADKLERHKIFKKNFDMLMRKTAQDGFPYVALENLPQDSCKYWAVSMTMIHTAQSNPTVFFSKKYADLFKREMDEGNLEEQTLKRSVEITAKTIELCENIKSDIQYAVGVWGIDYSVFDEANFVACD